jgi:hypothetical protein
MSADAKVWQDKDGWHGIADFIEGQIDVTDYELATLLADIELKARQELHWEIFQFANGPGLRGYRAK